MHVTSYPDKHRATRLDVEAQMGYEHANESATRSMMLLEAFTLYQAPCPRNPPLGLIHPIYVYEQDPCRRCERASVSQPGLHSSIAEYISNVYLVLFQRRETRGGVLTKSTRESNSGFISQPWKIRDTSPITLETATQCEWSISLGASTLC